MHLEPSHAVATRVARLLGSTPTGWRFVAGGYTPAARYVVSAAGERAFVKVATTPMTAGMLRREALAYEQLHGPFMPRFIGWDDDEREPLLVIEDLSGGAWPPPWDRRAVEQVLEHLDILHASTAPGLPTFAQAHDDLTGGWATVAEDPAPFLSLGLAPREWLVRVLPMLIEAEAACPTDGHTATHGDLRSDNICLTAAGATFIDWPGACRSNRELDLGAWLPSLCFEGGPAPEDLLPNAPQIAAWVSGYFAARAGLPIIPDAPFVRRVQREQLTAALPWVARALKLSEL
jgi:Phosphotransferase enzyme family